MERIHSSRIPGLQGKKVLVQGWAHDIRDFGNLKFLILKDKEGTVQITVNSKTAPKDVVKSFGEITKESVVSIEGKVVASEKARMGCEVVPEKIEIISRAKTPVPIDMSGKIDSDLSTRLDYRFLDVRNEKGIAIFKIRSKMSRLTTEYFDSNGFININTPKITVAGVESGSELFKVDYFGSPAYLSQSPQIYKQMMVAAGFEKVYEIVPVFRAEKSHTTRHLTEFTGIDFEQGFIKSEHDVMDTVEGLMVYIIEGLESLMKDELKLLGREKVKLTSPFPRITMKEAKRLLAEKGKKLAEEDDLDAEAEKLLGEIILEKHGSEFVFIYNYPWQKRPFYHMKPENDKNGTRSFDLLWNGIEITTGAQREHRYEILKAQAHEKGIEMDEMRDYAMIFQYGCPPHGGTGLGLDRMVETFLRLDNIREAILLPRYPERTTP